MGIWPIDSCDGLEGMQDSLEGEAVIKLAASEHSQSNAQEHNSTNGRNSPGIKVVGLLVGMAGVFVTQVVNDVVIQLLRYDLYHAHKQVHDRLLAQSAHQIGILYCQ
jgi:hypothetical protein